MSHNLKTDEKCRVCFSVSATLNTFSEKCEVNEEILSISWMFSCCAGIEEIIVDVPFALCDTCTWELINAYKFRRKCQDAHRVLMETSTHGADCSLSTKFSETIEDAVEMTIPTEADENENAKQTLDFGKHREPLLNTKIYTKSTKRPFECTVCPGELGFATQRCLNAHTIFVHKNGQCDQCPKKYTDYKVLLQHLGNHNKRPRIRDSENSSITEKFKCALCPEPKSTDFMTARVLKAHRISVHENGQCDQCPKRHDTYKAVLQHLTYHDYVSITDNNPGNVCYICGFHVKNTNNMQLHLRTHTGEKPFQCTLCDYACAVKHSLKIHMRTHTGEKPFKCKFCPKLFATTSLKSTHEKRHSEDRPYQCQVCDKTFKMQRIWKEHLIIHQPDLHKKCELCDKRFARNDQYKAHLLRLHA